MITVKANIKYLCHNIEEEINLIAKIENGCISCGLCVSTCPDVFRMGEDGVAEVYVDTIPSKDENEATEAQENCPVSVITIK